VGVLLCASYGVGAGGAVDKLRQLEEIVVTKNACALPGCSLKYESFMDVLQRAMSRGYVRDHVGRYVMDGLRNGFSIGLDRGSVVGRRIFKNFKSAYENRESVSDAIESRLEKHKTVLLGPADEVLTELKQKIKNFFRVCDGGRSQATRSVGDASYLRSHQDRSEQTNCAWHFEAQSRHLNEVRWF